MASQEHYIKVLRDLAPVVLVSLVAALVMVTPANADCSSAMQRYDDAANNENAQSVAKLRELGVPPEPVPIEKSCENLQYLQWRLPQEQELIALLNAERAECANVSLANGDYPERILAVIQSQIPMVTQQCQQYRAQQANAAPPSSAYASTNQSASCSTITGPGMTGGPTNCTPGQPTAVTTVPPPQQIQTATAPPQPAPQSPLDPATAAAQQIFGLLNLPAPQLQPTPAADPEAPARAAFDKGQAAFNAHDCATALQYFNQAASLTVSYGSTYSGWRDRAQACAGQPATVTTHLVPAEVPTPPAATAPGMPDLLAQRRQHCEELEQQGQIAAVSCWGGFADLAAQMGQPGLAKWANDHASALNKNSPQTPAQACQAQMTMPIAPGCNFAFPLRLVGAECNATDGSVGWTQQVPGGQPACCVKSNFKCQLEQHLRSQ